MLSVISVFNKKHQWSHQTGLSVKSVLSVFNKNYQWSHQTGLSVLSVLSVFNKDIRGSVVEPDRGEEAAPDGQVGGGVDLTADL